MPIYLVFELGVPASKTGGLIFFAFLILFEFLLVLSDPYVDVWTGGALGWKLLINAVFAGLIFPVHGFFERLLRRRLVRAKMKEGISDSNIKDTI